MVCFVSGVPPKRRVEVCPSHWGSCDGCSSCGRWRCSLGRCEGVVVDSRRLLILDYSPTSDFSFWFSCSTFWSFVLSRELSFSKRSIRAEA